MSQVLQAVFSGPSAATNRIALIEGSTNYFGQFPEFTSVVATQVGGVYQLQVFNFHNVQNWPASFVLNKTDSNPGEVIGIYGGEEGDVGKCVVGP